MVMVMVMMLTMMKTYRIKWSPIIEEEEDKEQKENKIGDLSVYGAFNAQAENPVKKT